MKYKKCPHCKKVKFLSSFYKRKIGSKQLYHSWCKDCFNTSIRKLYKAGKLKKRNFKTPKARFGIYRRGARRRNLIFNLSFKVFMNFWQSPCFYCGSKIETIGLDRINNTKGYYLKNIVPCCFRCNKFKGNYSQKEFLYICKKIADFIKRKE